MNDNELKHEKHELYQIFREEFDAEEADVDGDFTTIEQMLMNQHQAFISLIEKHWLWLNNHKDGKQLVIQGALLSHMELTQARLKRAIFIDCTFEFSVFDSCDFSQVLFHNCNFRHATFKQCDLRKSRFTTSDLTNTLFHSCKLESFHFTEANLREIRDSFQVKIPTILQNDIKHSIQRNRFSEDFSWMIPNLPSEELLPCTAVLKNVLENADIEMRLLALFVMS